MSFSKPFKLVILGLTLWPALYMVVFMTMIMQLAPGSPESFDVLFRVHMITMLDMAGLLLFYVMHVFRSPHVASDKRALWGIALFMGGIIAMPIYWFVHVWPERTTRSPRTGDVDAG